MEGTIGKSFSRSMRRRTFGLDIFIIKEMVTDWNFENLTLASDFCRFLADNFGTAHHSAKMEDTIAKIFSRSIRRRKFGLDIFIIKEMVTDWNFENLTLASDFCWFLADNFGTAHHSAKMEIPSERASQDLSDADNLVFISSLLSKWRLIEILTIWEPC